jgi:hypothetical protein
VDVRVARPARKHRIGNARILEALAGATLIEQDGDMLIYLGTDSRGVEIEIGVVPDDRNPNAWTVIHAMPAQDRRR